MHRTAGRHNTQPYEAGYRKCCRCYHGGSVTFPKFIWALVSLFMSQASRFVRHLKAYLFRNGISFGECARQKTQPPDGSSPRSCSMVARQHPATTCIIVSSDPHRSTSFYCVCTHPASVKGCFQCTALRSELALHARD